MTPASSMSVTMAATPKSIDPNRRLPSVPETAATICSTWLAPIETSAGNPNSTMSGTDSAGPPTPVRPEPNPAIPPTATSRTRCARGSSRNAVCRMPCHVKSV